MFENYPQRQEVTVTDIKMKFGSMVWFMVKLAFASIPAFFIVSVIVIAINVVILMILGGMGLGLSAIGNTLAR